MLTDLSPLIAATTEWLMRAYPSGGGALDRALADTQARQAVTVAAQLRYPTPVDAALVTMAGPGGSGTLDWITGADVGGCSGPPTSPTETAMDTEGDHDWRTWVDEVVASWAAALLCTPELAESAVAELTTSEHTVPTLGAFRRLLSPGVRDRHAAVLLRHPDLVAPVAELHRDQLVDRLQNSPTPYG
ncbi:hypothetical protein ACWCP6_18915 [Streptomyces sp. NPDC002004]